MSHIFISYSRRNQTYARALAEDLREHGFDVWIDDRIDIGDRWFAVIVRAIETCGAVVVVMSPDAEESEWVQREILIAQRDGKPIFPILLEGREFGVLIDLQYQDVRARGQMPDGGFYERLSRRVEPGAGKGSFIEPQTQEIQRVTADEPLPEGFRKRSDGRGPGLWIMLAIFALLVAVAGLFVLLSSGEQDNPVLLSEQETASAVAFAATNVTDSPTLTPTLTDSPTPTNSPTPTDTATLTTTPSDTPTPTETPSPTPFAGSVGAQIVFESFRDGGWELYVMSVGGSAPTRLTRDGADDHNAVYSPDGSRIAYESFRGGNSEIMLMDADGSNVMNLTSNNDDDFHPVWSPDGSQIAFYTLRDGNREIYVMNADGSNPRNLTLHPAEDRNPEWSPDGLQIAFYSVREGRSADIYVMDADGGNLRLVVDSPDADFGPSWSPDGLQIVFYSLRDGDTELYLINADGTEERKLTDNEFADRNPQFSPDGQWIVFQSARAEGEVFDIFMMNVAGDDLRQLTDTTSDDEAPFWRP